MAYSVKNVKTFTGREGYGYNCSLYKDGKNIGMVLDTADGGEIDLQLNSRELEHELRDYVNTLPSVKFDGMEIPQSPDMFIGNLVDEFLDNKKLRSLCSKNWVYEDPKQEGKLFCFKKPSDRKAIEIKYKDIIGKCLNEEEIHHE